MFDIYITLLDFDFKRSPKLGVLSEFIKLMIFIDFCFNFWY